MLSKNVGKLLVPRLTSFIPHKPTPKQQAFLLLNCQDAFYGGSAGGGKMMVLSSTIMTPFGSKKHGDIKVGDKVSNPDGSVSEVLLTHPIKEVIKYTVKFNDGTTADCCGDHLWKAWFASTVTKKRGNKLFGEQSAKIYTTAKLKEAIAKGKKPLIPVTNEVVYNVTYRHRSKIDSYMLGILLGDSCITHGISITSMEPETEEILNERNIDYNITTKPDNLASQYHFRGDSFQEYRSGLEKLKLFGTYSDTKFIPRQFKYNTIEDRYKLIQGLMDTDGYINSRGQLYYTTTSHTLSEDMAFVLRSLGAVVTITSKIPTYDLHGEKKQGKLAYTLYIKHRTPKRLVTLVRRKARLDNASPDLMFKRIESIVCDGEKVPMRCITVNNPNGLYLTNDFTVTHNSDALLMAALQYVDIPGYNALLLRDSYKNLMMPESLLDRAHEWLGDTDAHWQEKKFRYTFPSGATVTFGYLANPKDHLQYKCVTPDHEVLTKDGWKNITEVKKSELVASINPNTREFQYQQVSETHTYDYDGDMIRTHDSCKISFCVTPNHVIFGSTRKKKTLRRYRADNLPATVMIPQWSKYYEGIAPSYQKFQSDGNNGKCVEFSPKDWALFLGWFVSEGYINKSRNIISIAQCKSDTKKEIKELLLRNNINAHERVGDVFFSNKALCDWLLLNCGKGSKHITVPKEVKTWNKEYIGLLLSTLIKGDGTKYSDTHSVFVTTSPKLSNDVCELSIKCGNRTTVSKHDYDEKYHYLAEGSYYRVYITNVNEKDTIVSKPPYKEYYKGKVHCLSVEYNNTFLIRHKGKISWTGNSAAFQFVGIDEGSDLRWKSMRYLHSRLRRLKKNNNVPIRFRIASNPGGISHEELYNHYINPKTRNKDIIFIQASLRDNKYLDQDEYTKSLQNLDPINRRRLLNGDWTIREQGSLFSRSWFGIVDFPPPASEIKRVIRYWDLAATEESAKNRDPDFTVGLKLALTHSGLIYLLHAIRFRKSPYDTEAAIQQTAKLDGRECHQYFEQETGSSGKLTISNLSRYVIPNSVVYGHKSTGSKIQRAALPSSKAERGEIKIVNGSWVAPFFDEMELFPDGKNDDQVDTLSGGTQILTDIEQAGTFDNDDDYTGSSLAFAGFAESQF